MELQTILLLINLFFAHWVSDFLFQSRNMGKKKSSDIEAMLAHICAYTFGMFLVFAFPAFIFLDIPLEASIVFIVTNSTLHFTVDTVTSKLSSNAYLVGKEHKFWAIIGFDQFLHNAMFIATIPLLFIV